MKNIILTIIFIFLFFGVNAQNETNFEKSLSIEHIYGDESYTREKMEFEIINKKIYGRITNPNTDSLISSKTELNKSEIDLLKDFLKLISKYQNDCPEEFVSSYVQYYNVNVDKKEIKILKFCDWKKLTYFDIKQKIFGKYLENLDLEKQKLNDSLFYLLKGNWIESTMLDKLDKESICTIKKSVNNLTTKQFIEFKEDNKLLIHRNNKIIYYKYKIEFLNGKKYLNIFSDENKNGSEFIYGHNFLINSIDENEIKLTRS